jgi:site-specific recombinase XerD
MTTSRLSQLLPQEELSLLVQKCPTGETPLWQYWEEFVEMFLSANKSHRTIENVRESLCLFLRYSCLWTLKSWSDVLLVEKEIKRLQQEKHWTNDTRWTYVKNINTYFRYLERKRHITENPIKRLEKVAIESREQYTLSLDRAKAVLGHIGTRKDTSFGRLRNSLFFKILFLTGARPIELLHLTLDSFSENRSKIKIQGAKQKGRPRYYTMPQYIKENLLAYVQKVSYLSRQIELSKYLFLSSSKRTGWTMKGLNKLCQRLSKELEFKVNCYAFRRMVATKLYSENIDLRDIQQHLGHTRLTTTMRYIERSAGLTEKGTQVMGQLLA